jgi:hypothetical protein
MVDPLRFAKPLTRFLDLKPVLEKFIDAPLMKEIADSIEDTNDSDGPRTFEFTRYNGKTNEPLLAISLKCLGREDERVYIHTVTGPKLEITNGYVFEF